MTKVTFYILDSQGQSAKQFACRLVDKAWRQGLLVHIHTDNEEDCKRMDELLWSWREDRFLPHEILTVSQHGRLENESFATPSPITLGFTPPELTSGQLLINLSSEVPSFFKNFSRLCEIVIENEDQKASSRAKFRSYRQGGFQPEVHNITRSVNP